MAKVDPLFKAVPFDQLDESTKKLLADNGRQFGLDARGYYDMRGGVNASGYYGDSWNSEKNLTDEEYAAAAASGGGRAINLATSIKSAPVFGMSYDLSSKPKEAPKPGYYWTYGNFPDPNATPGTNEYASSYQLRWVQVPEVAGENIGVSGRPGTWSGRQKQVGNEVYFEYFKDDGSTEWISQGVGTAGVSGGSGAGTGGSSTGSTSAAFTASDGKTFTNPDAYAAYQAQLDTQRAQRQSAYDLLYQQFNEYGLGALVTPLKGLIEQAVPDSEFTIRLRESDAYKKRFAANAQRIAKGLRALSEAEYIQKEDAYQNIMRNYGMPESYYAKGDLGVQPGFEKLLANDVSAAELEDRIQTAQNRVINASPEITQALKSFYPNITNGDILAYALDPQNALSTIKRKVGAAEIGGAALQQGLQTDVSRAEQLQQYGVTQQQAQQGYQAIGGGLQRGSELASIYSQSPYTQTTAEQEVFGLPSATEAAAKRKKLIGLERATFGAQTGAGGAFERERAGGY